MTLKQEIILWGKSPQYGDVWLKITSNATKKEKDERKKQGFQLQEIAKGEGKPKKESTK